VTISQTEINVFYSHELSARLDGKEACPCDECAEIRLKIFKRMWRQIKKAN